MYDFTDLYPSKIYKDKLTGKVAGVSYKSSKANNINEILFSVDKAKELSLNDSDILDYLDITCIDVFVGNRNMIFPASEEVWFNKDLEDDGVVTTIDGQVISGHIFNRFAGIEMNNEEAIERYFSNYENDIETSRKK